MFERIRRFYEKRLWTAAMVRQAVSKGLLSEQEYGKIVGPAEGGPTEEVQENG